MSQRRCLAAWAGFALSVSSSARAQESTAGKRLVPGEAIESTIDDDDAVVETESLRTNYSDAPARGETWRIEVEEPGIYTIELRSYLFDAYLVLRGAGGEVLAEDDDGAVGIL